MLFRYDAKGAQMTNPAANSDKQVETLVEKVKHFQPLSDELNSLPYQDRLSIAKAVEAKIDQERAPGDVLPKLVISTGTDSQGHEHLASAQYTTTKSTADLYDLPGAIDNNPVELKSKLDLDSANSKNLQSCNLEPMVPPTPPKGTIVLRPATPPEGTMAVAPPVPPPQNSQPCGKETLVAPKGH
jgi:hypothetical protein